MVHCVYSFCITMRGNNKQLYYLFPFAWRQHRFDATQVNRLANRQIRPMLFAQPSKGVDRRSDGVEAIPETTNADDGR